MHGGYWCAITVKSLQTLLETFKDSIYNAYTQGGVPMVVTSSTHHTILNTTPSSKVGVAFSHVTIWALSLQTCTIIGLCCREYTYELFYIIT